MYQHSVNDSQVVYEINRFFHPHCSRSWDCRFAPETHLSFQINLRIFLKYFSSWVFFTCYVFFASPDVAPIEKSHQKQEEPRHMMRALVRPQCGTRDHRKQLHHGSSPQQILSSNIKFIRMVRGTNPNTTLTPLTEKIECYKITHHGGKRFFVRPYLLGGNWRVWAR